MSVYYDGLTADDMVEQPFIVLNWNDKFFSKN